MTGPDVLRLRTGVAATPMPTGVHLRGWRTSMTIDGGRSLWQVWRWLAPQLAAGVAADRLGALTDRAELQQAVDVLVEQLHAADLLVPTRADGPAAPWLDAAAPDPRGAQAVLAAPITIAGGPAELVSRVAVAAADCGLPTRIRTAGPDGVLLTLGRVAIVARALGDVGLVTPAGARDRVTALADYATGRITRTTTPSSAALLATVAGAAVHRLVSALAELPGPASGPDCLVVRVDPLRATYHPIAGAATTGAGPTTVDAALVRCAALTDPELGLLPDAVCGELPQRPAALAACQRGSDTTVIGIGSTGQSAHLQAVLAAAGAVLGLVPTAGAVGADVTHAAGTVLRHRVDTLVRAGGAGLPETPAWDRDPAARRWWRALTVALGVPATMRLRALPGAWHAEVHGGNARLGWAVEHDPGTAAAMAALHAAGIAQTGTGARTRFAAITGACPPPDIDPSDLEGDLGRWMWPAHTRRHEPALQEAMIAITGARPVRADGPAGWASTAIRAAGLAVVEVAP